MTSNKAAASSDLRSAQADDLMLREVNHRCLNDLQLVVSLLGLQSRRAAGGEVRQALTDAMERVVILARARRGIHSERPLSLQAALLQVCEALQTHAEPRSILISLHASSHALGLSASQITTLAMVVNELTTNAVKHAFEEGKSGRNRVIVDESGGGDLSIIVDDDGLPFPKAKGEGLGLGLAKRLMSSIGGRFIPPPPGTKCFELRLPVESA